LIEFVLGFRLTDEPFCVLWILGDPGGRGIVLVVLLVLDPVDATDSASDPRRALDLLFAIPSLGISFDSRFEIRRGGFEFKRMRDFRISSQKQVNMWGG
jgi:hypothetical protein